MVLLAPPLLSVAPPGEKNIRPFRPFLPSFSCSATRGPGPSFILCPPIPSKITIPPALSHQPAKNARDPSWRATLWPSSFFFPSPNGGYIGTGNANGRKVSLVQDQIRSVFGGKEGGKINSPGPHGRSSRRLTRLTCDDFVP